MRTSVVVLGGLGEAEARARRALVVAQARRARIGERRVREQELPRREARSGSSSATPGRLRKNVTWTPSSRAARVAEPAGDVPPLGAECRMAAVVARKRERLPRRTSG